MEEIGVRDYSPRLPYVKVSSNGTVTFFEPTSYETTCSVDIAHFPFDFQVILTKNARLLLFKGLYILS